MQILQALYNTTNANCHIQIIKFTKNFNFHLTTQIRAPRERFPSIYKTLVSRTPNSPDQVCVCETSKRVTLQSCREKNVNVNFDFF